MSVFTWYYINTEYALWKKKFSFQHHYQNKLYYDRINIKSWEQYIFSPDKPVGCFDFLSGLIMFMSNEKPVVLCHLKQNDVLISHDLLIPQIKSPLNATINMHFLFSE